MSSFFTDNDDLLFYFDRGIDWAPLVELTEYGWRAAGGPKSAGEAVPEYRAIMEMLGEMVATEVAPYGAELDREGARLEGGEAVEGERTKRIFQVFKDAELHRLCIPRELGGLNAPLLLYFLGGEMIARGDVSTMTHFSFHGGMGLAMLAFSIHEGSTVFDVPGGKIASTRFSSQIDELARGDAWGCMDITEPNAGSDMAALRARGELGADGRWYVTGQKIFITSGHGKYHFVIARTEELRSSTDPMAGLSGLSMFLVKTYEDLPNGKRERYVTLDRLEEKLGHHGSVTAALSFDRAPAELIGQRGEGFKYMLTLMNNARVGVGFESIGVAEAAYRLARDYAAERRSMGKPIAEHEMIADYLDEMRTDIQGLRALAVASAYAEETAQKLGFLSRFLEGDERGRARVATEQHAARAVSRRFTPLLKYLAAEKAVEIARRSMQIHGGVGYTKEYGAEKLLRDALVMPIYEGTSQIQSLMAMKDALLGIVKNPGAFARRTAEARWRSVSARDPLERSVARIQSLSLGAQQHLMAKTAGTKLRTLRGAPIGKWRGLLTSGWDPKRDFALAMLHAERLTHLMADEAIVEVLLAQAQAHPDRRELLERYLDRAEPRARALHHEITTTGSRILSSLRSGGTASSAVAEAAE